MKNKYTVTSKEWFDKANGNSYCAVQITDNNSGEMFKLPFQYGYGSYGEQIASEFLKDYGEQFDYLSKIAHCMKIEDCLKRDVVAWGTE